MLEAVCVARSEIRGIMRVLDYAFDVGIDVANGRNAFGGPALFKKTKIRYLDRAIMAIKEQEVKQDSGSDFSVNFNRLLSVMLDAKEEVENEQTTVAGNA